MADPSPQPVDRLLGGYFLLTAAAFLFPQRPDAWPLLLLGHLALGSLLLSPLPGRARSWAAPGEASSSASNSTSASTSNSASTSTSTSNSTSASGSGGRWVAGVAMDWYPLLLMPFLYWELPQLSGALWGGRFFDGVVMAWEEGVFGHQPSATMALRWDSLALSETLHLAYLAYYPIIFFFPAALYLLGRRAAFQETVFALMLAFTASYVLFTLFPVQGPRYLFPAPGGRPAEGLLYQVTHTVLESGSSRGAAFPSAHAAVAAVQTINAVRHLPGAALLLALITVGLCVGAVYGGFHYAMDMVAGLALGLIIGWLAPAARGALR